MNKHPTRALCSSVLAQHSKSLNRNWSRKHFSGRKKNSSTRRKEKKYGNLHKFSILLRLWVAWANRGEVRRKKNCDAWREKFFHRPFFRLFIHANVFSLSASWAPLRKRAGWVGWCGGFDTFQSFSGFYKDSRCPWAILVFMNLDSICSSKPRLDHDFQAWRFPRTAPAIEKSSKTHRGANKKRKIYNLKRNESSRCNFLGSSLTLVNLFLEISALALRLKTERDGKQSHEESKADPMTVAWNQSSRFEYMQMRNSLLRLSFSLCLLFFCLFLGMNGASNDEWVGGWDS